MKRISSLLQIAASAFLLSSADQAVKEKIESGEIDNSVINHSIIPVTVEKHHNTGFAGNVLSSKPKFVASVSSAMTIVQGFLTVKAAVTSDSKLFKVANTLMLAGAVSNSKDRENRGYVVDYIKIKKKIFNIADFYIFAGAILMLVYIIIHPGKTLGLGKSADTGLEQNNIAD